MKTSCGKFLNLAHYFPYDVKLRLLAHSRSFLANQNARNAIVGAENLLKVNISLVSFFYGFSCLRKGANSSIMKVAVELNILTSFHRYNSFKRKRPMLSELPEVARLHKLSPFEAESACKLCQQNTTKTIQHHFQAGFKL